MRALQLLMILIGIHLTLFIFLAGVDPETSDIWQTIAAGNWDLIDLFNVLTDNVWTVLAGAGIIAGLVFNRTSYIYLSFTASIISWGFVYRELYQKIIDTINPFNGELNFLILAIFVAMMMSWVWVMIEFARGRDA